MPNELKIDFGDGVSALDRANRAIVLMLDGAIAELLSFGYQRDFDHITFVIRPEDEGPSIEMRGERYFDVGFVMEGSLISIQGHWVKRPAPRSWIRRLFTRRYHARTSRS